MSSSNLITYEDEMEEDGWYLLVIEKKSKQAAQNFDYFKIKKVKMENITTTALNYLKKDGMFRGFDVKKLKDYDITLLFYSNKKLSSRYIMKYKQQINTIDGFYDGWEYMVKNKDGEFIPYDKNYKKRRVYRAPIIVSIAQILFFVATYYYSKEIASYMQDHIYRDNGQGNFTKYYTLTNALLAFLMFFVALIYSTLTILVKDSIKTHYLKDNLKRIYQSTFVFEIPVYIAAIYSVTKISQFEGKIIWNIWIPLVLISILLITAKAVFTCVLEREKKLK